MGRNDKAAAFLNALVAAARVDGQLYEDEVDTLAHYAELLGIDQRTFEAAFEELEQPYSPDEALRLLFAQLQQLASAEERMMLTAAVEEVLYADGALSREEVALLGRLRQMTQSLVTPEVITGRLRELWAPRRAAPADSAATRPAAGPAKAGPAPVPAGPMGPLSFDAGEITRALIVGEVLRRPRSAG